MSEQGGCRGHVFLYVFPRPENLDAARDEMQKHFKVDWEHMRTAQTHGKHRLFDATNSIYGSMSFSLVGF